ncbi:MAG: DUF305 domain-containing protein [Caldilineaceae bacterium]
MFKQGSTRISLVMMVALALLIGLIVATVGQADVVLAKTRAGNGVQQAHVHQAQPMTSTTTMLPGQMGAGQRMQMMGMMLQMMGATQNMLPTATGVMTGAMPMTGAMGMGNSGMMPMQGMMDQMHTLMMQQMQNMLASCPSTMPVTGSMTSTMPMTSSMAMSNAMPMAGAGMDPMLGTMLQMMQSHMQQMMGGMGMMGATMPMTGAMPMHHRGQMSMLGRDMQMMGLMMQMMGEMQDMLPANTGMMSSTLPMTGAMPMQTELCQMMGMMNQMMQRMSGQPQPFDLRFIDSMIMHHQGAVAMAKEAQQQAAHPELKQMAADIIKSQSAEIQQMQAWRKAWYPNAPATSGLGMSMGAMKIAAAASKPFDLRFIEAMLPHHAGAIAMAKEAQAKVQHQELKTLANNIIAAQQKEIAQMQAWKAAWFK